MYAIIRAGGKQAKVHEGDVIDVERIKDATDEVTFVPLLIVNDDGSVVSARSDLEKATVTAEVVGEHRGDKVEVFKYKNKSGYRRRQGHRQTYTTVKVTGIAAPGAKKGTAEKSTKGKAAAEEPEAAELSAAAEKPSRKKPAEGKPSREKPAAKRPKAKATAETADESAETDAEATEEE